MTLLELLSLLRKNLWLVIAMPVAFAVITAIVCWGILPNQYTAETSLYVLTRSASTTSDSVTSSDMTASQYIANDIAELAKTSRVTDAAAAALGVDKLTGFNTSVGSSTTNRIISLKVTGTNPESAAKVANELARQTATVAVDVMNLEAVNVVEEAQTPETPSGPNRVMYTLVALLAGLFLAIAIIVLMDMLDTTIKSDEEAEELLGLPVIGRMPYVKDAN
ncbi:MAG: Wzz/FepE/Etk N-terminal domain-containing protein [Coriobacteriia bacterium]|nr:Wzz/FepE/Etk N-terminal domain-containing protein [Coriobacteriia bacterium]